MEQWTEIFDNCLKKLSGAERKKLRAFDRENLVASLGQDFRQWKLPESMSSDVRPFFEQTKMLIQKLREALTLPGPYQPEFKSELLDGGGYVVLWVSANGSCCETSPVMLGETDSSPSRTEQQCGSRRCEEGEVAAENRPRPHQ